MTDDLAIRAFFDEPTNTVSYLVWDRASSEAAVIDPVLDFDHRSGKASTASADPILAAAEEEGMTFDWVLETHAHADHLSAAPYLKAEDRGQGRHRRAHRATCSGIFRPIFNLDDVSGDGSEFDRLFADGEHFAIGGLDVEVLYVPGHTPADVAYKDRRRGLRRRHAVHARLRHRARRLPRRRRAQALRARCSGCWRCRTKPGSSCATTTRRRAAITTSGRPRSREEKATSTSPAAARTSSSPGARPRDAGLADAAAPAAVDPDQHPRRQVPGRPSPTASATSSFR